MSLSDDHTQDDFVPFDIEGIKRFDTEIVQNQEEIDSHQFKTLFSPSDDNKEPEPFHLLRGTGEKKKTEPFSLLFDQGEKKEKGQPESGAQPVEDGFLDSGPKDSQAPEEPSMEEQAREQGYQEGFARGQKEGFEQGHKDGLEKGEQEGFASGEEKGFQEGYEKGEKEGIGAGEQQGMETAQAAARQEVQETLNALKKALDEVNSMADHIVDRYEQKLIRLVFKIAQKVVDVTLDADDQVIKRTVLDALKTLVNPEEIVLSISPDDYAYIETVKDEFFEEISSLQSVSVQSDSLINRGGCKIKTNTGTVAADPEEKMKAIEEALMTFHKR